MRTFLIYISLIFITSCVSEEEKRATEYLENYVKAKNEFNYDLTDHFPNILKSNRQLSVGYPAGAYGNGMANIIYSQELDSTEFRNTIKKLSLNKISAYKPTDSLFIIIGDTLDYGKKDYGIPIPSFENYERDFGLNSKYLTENHKIYVLEYKPGKFMEEKYLTSNPNLPEKWKNGFSRGIATDEKGNELIYWLCVW
ncbi:hypothetical protein SAMN04487906_2385 [Zhouia amylolytica]|uniref:Uncharacterized protein n=1 Tax=Zhouia amylolytica TaxID=376730 RepID=A0A1I6U5L2_9FLAO|nr:hypothetical protein [Zhouia amylolytica]SFS96648.1 hypothetical protein SAMN04487906_2385 [Zhouia amylolytica]